MPSEPGSPARCGRRTSIAVVAAGGFLLPGCQTAPPEPIDLPAHRLEVESRLDDLEPLTEFAARLEAAGGAVPDRFDPGDGLDAAEAEVVALLFDPDLRIARLEAGVALARFEHAGRWTDPVLGFDGAEVLSPEGPFEFGLRLNLTLPVSGRLEALRDEAAATHEAELRRLVDAEWRVRTELRRAWTDWDTARERTGVLEDVVARLERLDGLAGRLERAGSLPRVQRRGIRIELQQRRAELAAARRDVELARTRILARMGLAPSAGVELVAGPPPTGDRRGPDDGDRLDRIIRANTELAVRRAEHRTAERSLALALREQYPDLTVGGGYGREDDDRLLLGFSLPIPIFNANRGPIAEAIAHRSVTRAAAEATFERLAHELAESEARLAAAEEQRATLLTDVVPLLDEQAGELIRLAELGEVDPFLQLDVLTRRHDVLDRLLELRTESISARIAIDRLLGPDQPAEPAPVVPAAPPDDRPDDAPDHDRADEGESP